MVMFGGWKKFKERFLIPLINEIVDQKISDSQKLMTDFGKETYADRKSVDGFMRGILERADMQLKNYRQFEERLSCQRNRLDQFDVRLHKLERTSSSSKNDEDYLATDKEIRNQITRCRIFREGDDVNVEKLNKIPKAFDNEDLQETLDAFNFEETAAMANKLGFTSNDNEITVRELVKDAIEMFKKLEDCSEETACGRLQCGRLVALRLWSSEENAPWYMLNYFIEHTEV